MAMPKTASLRGSAGGIDLEFVQRERTPRELMDECHGDRNVAERAYREKGNGEPPRRPTGRASRRRVRGVRRGRSARGGDLLALPGVLAADGRGVSPRSLAFTAANAILIAGFPALAAIVGYLGYRVGAGATAAR